jgi:hypothetical protein
VSVSCLKPTQQCFSYISWREQVNFQLDDDEVCFVLDQHAQLDFYSAGSLKQQSTDRHVTPHGHISLIPSQPVFCGSIKLEKSLAHWCYTTYLWPPGGNKLTHVANIEVSL